jgi:hypothetical protein
MSYYSSVASRFTKPRIPGREAAPDAGDESKTIAVPRQRARHPKPHEAGSFVADIASFRLYLAARNLSQATIRIYVDAACWFAATHLLSRTDKTRWEQVEAADIRRWIVWLLGRLRASAVPSAGAVLRLAVG